MSEKDLTIVVKILFLKVSKLRETTHRECPSNAPQHWGCSDSLEQWHGRLAVGSQVVFGVDLRPLEYFI